MGPCLATACVATPPLDVPPKVAATAWSIAPPNQERPAADLSILLGSPELADLIARARAQSPTLLAARARIDQALAQLRIARGAALPTLSVGASVAGTGTSTGTATSVAGTGTGTASAFDFAANFATIDAGLSLDLGGGAAAGRRSAAARARAAAFDLRALDLAVTTELARAFVMRATLHARIALSDRSIAQALELQHIVEVRRREGVATDVDVGLQVVRIGQLRLDRDRLQQSFDETRVAIALLVGEEAPGFSSVPADVWGFTVGSIALPAPSQLAATRPDVEAAEARIEAAGGDVAQARAAFFPRLDLSIGRGATLLTGGALSSLTIGANLLAPIFARNRLKGNLADAAAVQRESVQAYRTVLLGALGEAENALSAAAHARDRGIILATLDSRAKRTVDLARDQYLEGEADLRQLLDARDFLIATQDAQIVNLQEQLDAAILLFKVSCNQPSPVMAGTTSGSSTAASKRAAG